MTNNPDSNQTIPDIKSVLKKLIKKKKSSKRKSTMTKAAAVGRKKTNQYKPDSNQTTKV
jgi:hypothetical protein